MSDDNPHSTNGSSGKSWLDKLKNSISGEPRSKEELVSVITDAEQNEIIDPQTREMIEGVIGVNEMRVRDIMIPRAQMTTIDVEQKVEEFLPVMLESAHSRFPVISEDKDHIEGILLAKDLLAFAFNAALPLDQMLLKNISINRKVDCSFSDMLDRSIFRCSSDDFTIKRHIILSSQNEMFTYLKRTSWGLGEVELDGD